MKSEQIALWSALEDRSLTYALVENVDLVIVRDGNSLSVFYGRCLHRGALMSDGHLEGEDVICGVHGWDYRIATGVSAYNNSEALKKFTAWVKDDAVLVDADEIATWEKENPQPYDRDAYLGLYADTHGSDEEPWVDGIHSLARDGLAGAHGMVAAMGVPPPNCPAGTTFSS